MNIKKYRKDRLELNRFSRRDLLKFSGLGVAGLLGTSLHPQPTKANTATPDTETDADDVAGKVLRIQKSAFAMQDAVPRPLAAGSEIQIGDVISTGKDARLEFELLDGSVVRLGERTIFIVTDYVDRRDEENIALRLLEGAFQAQTGAIGKRKPEAVRVNTPTGSIGIRGTVFWGGPLDGDFEVALIDGAGLYVETRAGRVELTEVGQGTTIDGTDVAPTAAVAWPAEKIARAVATITFDR